MTALLNRAGRQFLRRHPWQLTLALLGIALGVAVSVAIALALESALNSFELAGKSVAGQATHRISGGDGGLDEKIYTRLRIEGGIQNMSPVVEAYVALKRNPDERFTLYGIDPFIEPSLRAGWRAQLKSDAGNRLLTRFLTEPGAALIGRQSAERLGLKINDNLPVLTDTGEQALKIVGLIDADDAVARQLSEKLLVADIATAQELTGLFGKLSFIELRLDADDNRANVQAKITRMLPANVQLRAAESKSQAMREMTEAFAVNLNALGLLSLLVGMFLIYNAMTFLVVQRRSLIGSLRAIGVTRRQIFALILREALLLGAVGTAIGIAAGLVLGRILLQPIAATLDTLYFRTDSGVFLATPRQIAKAVLLGFTATLLAVLPPAWEATKVVPNSALLRSQLESGFRSLIKFTGLLSLTFIAGGMAVTMFSEKSVRLGLAGIFLLLSGFALLTPGATLLLMQAFERLGGKCFGLLGKLPARLVAAEISRTGVAVAALMIAVAATIGMDLMIGSFRQTVEHWVKTSLQGDLYIALQSNPAAPGKAAADRALKAEIATLPGVALVSSMLRTETTGESGPLPLFVYELHQRSYPGFIFIAGKDPAVWERFERQQAVLVTEAYAYHHGIKPGDNVLLQTGNGPQAFAVLAVYADYSGDRGHLAMSRRQYLRYWPDLGYSGLGVFAQAHADLPQLENAIRSKLPAQHKVTAAGEIYRASMEVFAQTFTVTEILRGLAAGIAFVGVFGALMALQFERTRQLGILRAIGFTPGQLSVLITTETGLMGLTAGFIALPVGYLVAYVLIFVVYRRSFGWTLAFHFHPAVLLQGLALAFIAALFAGIYPAFKMARTEPAEALRTE